MAQEEEVEAPENETETGSKAEAEKETDGADTPEEKKEPESPFYATRLPNRVVLTRGTRSRPPLNFYVERARRILRSDDDMVVCGIGQGMVSACTLVEILKRQKVAKVQGLETKMNTQASFRGGGLEWTKPTPCIEFRLTAGEHSKFVTDFSQRKVVEIFENNDKDKSGSLTADEVRSLDLGDAFFSSDEQKAEAEKALKGYGPNVNLPNFIRYASLLISPLLRNSVFKERLAEKYNVTFPQTPSKKSSPARSPHGRGRGRGRGRGDRGDSRGGRGRGGGGRYRGKGGRGRGRY